MKSLKVKMRDLNAKRAATEVLNQMSRGEKANTKKAMRAVGFTNDAPSVSGNPNFQRIIKEYTSLLEYHRAEVLNAMMGKNLDDEQYRTLTDAQTKLTHDIQLLTGGKTENIGLDKDRETLKAIVAAIQIDKQ